MPRRNHRLFEVGTFLSAHQNQFENKKSHLIGGNNSKHGAIFMHKQPHLLLQGSKLGKARQLIATPVIKHTRGKFRVASPGEHIPGIQSGKLPKRNEGLIENSRSHIAGSGHNSSHNSSHLTRIDDPFPPRPISVARSSKVGQGNAPPSSHNLLGRNGRGQLKPRRLIGGNPATFTPKNLPQN